MRVVARICNHFKVPLCVDLEPIPLSYVLAPEGEVDVVSADNNATAHLNFGMTDKGVPFISVWKMNAELLLHRDGVDVLADE